MLDTTKLRLSLEFNALIPNGLVNFGNNGHYCGPRNPDKSPTLMRLWQTQLKQILALPSLCTLCKQFHKGPFAVCAFCTDLLKPLGPCCEQCAYPLPNNNPSRCGLCLKNPPPFDKAYIGFTFEEPLRSLLHQFKYHHALYLGAFLAQLMANSFPRAIDSTPCLIPVPMHPLRIKQRGFNQAAVLAKLLAKQLNLPFNLHGLKKVMNTSPQVSLNSQQRKNNLAQAFKAESIPYSHVILIDDLLTTGSTAKELATTLKKAGVTRVDICCCARAI